MSYRLCSEALKDEWRGDHGLIPKHEIECTLCDGIYFSTGTVDCFTYKVEHPMIGHDPAEFVTGIFRIKWKADKWLKQIYFISFT